MKSPIEVFDDDIAELERQLERRKKARLQYLRIEAQEGNPSVRFHGKQVLESIRILLIEHGHAESLDTLKKRLVAGGAVRETDRKEQNIDDSVRKSLKHEKLIEKNGLIGLPEWADEKFVPSGSYTKITRISSSVDDEG